MVSYTDAIVGKYSNIKSLDPIGKYFAERGARCRTNIFQDHNLVFTDNVIHNLIKLIQSGRCQEFERIDITIPKAMVNYYLKVARQLMALEQVVIEVFEDNDNLVFKTYYPERIWLESAYWGARSRTELHPKHLTDNELDQVKRMCLLPDRQSRDIEILHKALDL